MCKSTLMHSADRKLLHTFSGPGPRASGGCALGIKCTMEYNLIFPADGAFSFKRLFARPVPSGDPSLRGDSFPEPSSPGAGMIEV